MESKRLQLLQEILPGVSRVGHLVAEQDAAGSRQAIDEVAATGKKLGIEVVLLTAGKVEELEPVIAAAAQRGIGAILVGAPSTLLYAQQKAILEAGDRHRMPLVSGHLAFAVSGGLVQYNVLDAEVPSLTANYVVRILKGQRPAELPVQQPTRFTLALNLKTAGALGLEFPPRLLSSADQVIE